MKHLKKFNEELRPYTYRSASKKLQEIGHVKRAARLDDWATKRQEDDARKAIQQKRATLSQNPSFHMKFFRDRWSNGRVLATEPYLEGNFYLELYYESDSMRDDDYFYQFELNDKRKLQFPFSIGLFPADGETQEKVENADADEQIEHIYNNMIWPIYLYLGLNNDSKVEEGKSFVLWEEREDGSVIFADRREALRFKRFLSESVNSNNIFGNQFKKIMDQINEMIDRFENRDKYYWEVLRTDEVPRDFEGNISPVEKIYKGDSRDYYWQFGNKKSNLRQIDIKHFENAIKRMSVNDLYRD